MPSKEIFVMFGTRGALCPFMCAASTLARIPARAGHAIAESLGLATLESCLRQGGSPPQAHDT
jgi:hypothetical protein